MSNLPGNPHAELAEADIEYPGAWNELEAVTALLQTSARAALALAYEQRTANLIALWASPGNLPDGSYDKGMEMSGVHYGELATQIKARLGLGETNA